jgi:hypothetical protein
LIVIVFENQTSRKRKRGVTINTESTDAPLD